MLTIFLNNISPPFSQIQDFFLKKCWLFLIQKLEATRFFFHVLQGFEMFQGSKQVIIWRSKIWRNMVDAVKYPSLILFHLSWAFKEVWSRDERHLFQLLSSTSPVVFRVEGAHSRESLMVERDDGNWIGIDAIGILFDPLDECGQE